MTEWYLAQAKNYFNNVKPIETITTTMYCFLRDDTRGYPLKSDHEG